MERTALTLSPEKLVGELSAMLGDADPSGVVIAFDGDGTLWSGDVGEDLFRAAMRDAYLLEDATPALLAEAARHHVALGSAKDANAIARTLLAAYLAGSYPERETCAMMSWCYAGRMLAEVADFAATVLKEDDLQSRLNREVAPVIAWARNTGIRLVLISASPRVVIDAAGAFWGFEPADIAAATPAVEAGRVLPRMAGQVPYAEAKLSAGRELFGKLRWLAAFGDNVFDIDMLKGAELGVAVRPKPKLETELAALGLRLLERGVGASRSSAR
ncbi:MAG TPA: HAD family hydrolase [Polyangiaceae bacterium]|nr:HAD family hydrolase [Polyangiaceae bacterium]